MVASKGMEADARKNPDAYVEPARETKGEKLKHFRLAGKDRVWHAAEAVIDGNEVVVTSAPVPEPVGVQYAHSASPIGANLYNRAGLPATPFAYFDGKQLFQADDPAVIAKAKAKARASENPYLQVATLFRHHAHLPKRLILAIERRDMLEILDYQDSIADVAQDIAEIVEMRGMVTPESLKAPMLALVRRVIAACDAAEVVIKELDELVETGFRGRGASRVERMIDDLSKIESDTDELAEKAQRELFAIESELGVSTVFWHELINWVADLADYSERVGNRLRLLIAS